MRRAVAAFILLLSICSVSCDSPPAGSTVVLVVRHAEKASDAADSPLTEAGHQRAQALARAVEEAGLSAIYSSQFRRNLDTAQPVSARIGVAVTQVPVADLSSPGDYGKALAGEVVAKHRGRTVLVVSHGNTIATVIEGLTGRAPALSSVEYHDLFVVTIPPTGPAGLVKAQYGERVGGS
jgi:broad specificity phosphatase PhoE